MADAISAILTAGEVDALIHELQRSRDELLALLPPADSPAWQSRDGDGRWTVAEVVEHLVTVETLSGENNRKAFAGGPRDDWRSVTVAAEESLPQVAVASRRVAAPPFLEPAQAWAPEELPLRFQQAREATIALVKEWSNEPLRAILPAPHPALGQLNLAQRLLAIAYHTDRHTLQIRRCLGGAKPAE